MTAEPTEMAGVAEAETEAAYAWALDYDDPDEFPTQRTQQLTSQHITALGLVVSLTVIVVAGLVTFFMVRDANGENRHSPLPTPVTVTVQAAPPPAPVPAPAPDPTLPPSPPPPAPSAPAADEARFVEAVRDNIITSATPGGRPTHEQLVASGYRACSVIARYPDNQRRAATAFYVEEGFNISVMTTDNPVRFMSYAQTYLCPSQDEVRS